MALDARSLNDVLNAPLNTSIKEPSKLPRWVVIGAIAASVILTCSFVVGTIVVGADASARSAAAAAAVQEARAPIATADKRADDAKEHLAALPTEREGARWLNESAQAVAQVTDIQNKYLAQTGPLSLEGIPTENPKPGLFGDKNYTPEERLALAKNQRDLAENELQRLLVPNFGSASGPTSFFAAAPWYESLNGLRQAGLETGAGLQGYVWSAAAPEVFEQDGRIPVAWQLRKVGSDEVLAEVRAFYDTLNSRFADPVLVAISKEVQ